MTDQTGPGVAAMRARQVALSNRHTAVTEADRALAGAFASAYAATVEGINRLDAIQSEIDSAVQNRAALAVDTPMGAREFQRFLLARHREIIAIVSEAHQDDGVKKALLESLRSRYSVPAG